MLSRQERDERAHAEHGDGRPGHCGNPQDPPFDTAEPGQNRVTATAIDRHTPRRQGLDVDADGDQCCAVQRRSCRAGEVGGGHRERCHSYLLAVGGHDCPYGSLDDVERCGFESGSRLLTREIHCDAARCLG